MNEIREDPMNFVLSERSKSKLACNYLTKYCVVFLFCVFFFFLILFNIGGEFES